MTNERKSNFTWFLQFLLPPILVIAVLSLLGVGLMLAPAPETKPASQILPVVEVIEAQSSPITLETQSQGIVQSRTETLLVAEVSGRIQSISNAFFTGGYFKKGDPLVTIDSIDYEANLATAKGRLAEANLTYQQERALADQAREDWESLDRGEASELTLRKPQLERASALLESAKASVQMAQRDLDRTVVRAPYDGRIREKIADIGQMVAVRQSQLARIYSTDTAEIRLPISLKDIEYLQLPESYSNQAQSVEKPKVTISAQYGGETYSWEGVIDRTEGAIDSRTRLSYVVAKIEDPYKRESGSARPPLKVGLFVEASIEGKRIDNAFRIPRKALQENDTVFTIDQENRLEFKSVDVLKVDTEWAIIASGLENGDRICVTPLEYAVIGMQVKLDTGIEMVTLPDEQGEEAMR